MSRFGRIADMEMSNRSRPRAAKLDSVMSEMGRNQTLARVPERSAFSADLRIPMRRRSRCRVRRSSISISSRSNHSSSCLMSATALIRPMGWMLSLNVRLVLVPPTFAGGTSFPEIDGQAIWGRTLLLRRSATPIAPKPRSIIAQVAGSGTASVSVRPPIRTLPNEVPFVPVE